MANKLEYLEEDEFESVIDSDVEFTGKIHADKSCLVKGHIKDTKVKSNLLVIIDEGNVSGDVYCDTLTVFGKCFGSIHVNNILSLQKGGRLNGKIKSKSLIVGEGGIFNGECSMEEQDYS